jgi:hypothetical protein
MVYCDDNMYFDDKMYLPARRKWPTFVEVVIPVRSASVTLTPYIDYS